MPPRSPQPRHPVSDRPVERLSVSLAADHKEALEEIAAEKNVSLAWVIRDAIEKYLKNARDPG